MYPSDGIYFLLIYLNSTTQGSNKQRTEIFWWWNGEKPGPMPVPLDNQSRKDDVTSLLLFHPITKTMQYNKIKVKEERKRGR